MSIDKIEEKVRAEIEVSKKGLGDVAMYGFVANETKDDKLTTRALLHFGYSLNEIQKMKTGYIYSKNRSLRAG